MILNIWRFIVSLPGSLKPEGLILSTFSITIIVGALLLWLPFSHRGVINFSDAIFTATSAVCVTGLIVVDTSKNFTIIGQVIIMLLIQLGGLGVMTFAVLTFQLLGKRLSLYEQAAMTEALVHEELHRSFFKYFHKILLLQVSFEAAGAVILFLSLIPSHNFIFSAYSAIFHSISAFCNAGFSLYSNNLLELRNNYLFIFTITILVFIGSIGYPVIFDVMRNFRSPAKPGLSYWVKFTIHTRITLFLTVILLLSGTVLLFLTAFPLYSTNLVAAAFQSVIITAGFNTIRIDMLPLSSLIVLLLLMFIGGSPGSCAGGVKTTTFALWISQLFSRIRGKHSVVIYNRYIPQALVNRSTTIINFAFLLNFIGLLLLSISEKDAQLHQILFEQISAFGTVGLSTGLTPNLSDFGRFWIMLTMFIGRTGPLTGVILLLHKKPVDVKYPEGKVMIG